ncbi:MAG: hypothetical protein AABX38_01720 [Candidatus Micrarchaeota archaeon]
MKVDIVEKEKTGRIRRTDPLIIEHNLITPKLFLVDLPFLSHVIAYLHYFF